MKTRLTHAGARPFHSVPKRSLMRKGLSVGVIAALFCGAVAAGDVRLSSLLPQALSVHPTVLQARNQAKAAGFDIDAARWARYPTLSTNVRSDSGYSQSLASVQMPLWDGGRISTHIKLSEVNLQIAEATIREAELNAMTQIASAFLESLRLDARLRSAKKNVAEHEKLLNLIERRVSSEISPTADGTLAQARLQQAISERIQIQRQLEAAQITLAQWAGPIGGPLVSPKQIMYRAAETDEALMAQVFLMSGQLKRLKYQIQSAEAQVELAQRQVYPTVVAGVQHIVSGPNLMGIDRDHAYVELQFQPGAGLSFRSATFAAESKKDAAEQESQALELNLRSQVRSLVGEVAALQAQLKPAQNLLEGTTEVVDSYLRQYQIGRKNWLDVLNALREKTQALYNLADVQFGLQQSQIKLMLLSGEISGNKTSAIYE
jgi:adhesin transport system outer membrane protein